MQQLREQLEIQCNVDKGAFDGMREESPRHYIGGLLQRKACSSGSCTQPRAHVVVGEAVGVRCRCNLVEFDNELL